MSNIIIRPPWYLPERSATDERGYRNRREFIRLLGLGAAGFGLLGCTSSDEKREPSPPMERAPGEDESNPNADLYPAQRNDRYTVERPLTDEEIATSYNNFYEFSEDKEAVRRLASQLDIRPWNLEITGLVDKPLKLTVDDLVRKLPLEERIYRFRCVEAWGMTVPWTGFALKDLLALAEPKSSATHVRFLSFYRPEQAPNQKRATWYEWPYYEALRMDEAMHELTMGVTGLYGHELPKQNGAPLRIITPWKYGYKSPKSIVKIELVDHQPKTFWNDLAPSEYSFLSNVDPEVPHPRWSQATERLIGSDERVDTRKFNGYGELVASLYA